jgi:hypothetical protein
LLLSRLIDCDELRVHRQGQPAQLVRTVQNLLAGPDSAFTERSATQTAPRPAGVTDASKTRTIRIAKAEDFRRSEARSAKRLYPDPAAGPDTLPVNIGIVAAAIHWLHES